MQTVVPGKLPNPTPWWVGKNSNPCPVCRGVFKIVIDDVPTFDGVENIPKGRLMAKFKCITTRCSGELTVLEE